MSKALFSPLKLRDLEIENRIVVAPMCQYSADNGSVTDWHLVHLGGMALSGAGMIIVEATGVEADGRITPGCVGLYSDDNEQALKRVLAFCREHGSAKIGIQLAHAGRKASSALPWNGGASLGDDDGGWATFGPSAIPFSEGGRIPKEMDRADMDRIRDAFVQAAERSQRLGFDLAELHAAHGYLMHAFLSPLSNQRQDEYGGSLENRMRFPLEIFTAIRNAWPETKPLGVRVSATDWIEGGWTLDETVIFASKLKQLGCDFIDASGGGSTADRPPVGTSGPGYQVEFSERIKKDADILTIAVGMIRDPQLAENIVASGQADMVALARGYLYDPRWAWHAAEELGASAPYPKQYLRAHPDTWPKAFPDRG